MNDNDKLFLGKEREYWDEKVQQYINGESIFGEEVLNLWGYFKFCWKEQSEYFIKHPLLDYAMKRLKRHEYILNEQNVLYRTRIYDNAERVREIRKYYESQKISEYIMEMEKSKISKERISESIEDLKRRNMCSRIVKKQIDNGFIGYGEKESGAPPIKCATVGRCNMQGVSFLYAAGDEHTSIAEVKPKFGNTVSVAKVLVKQNLLLVDFCIDYNKSIDDMVLEGMKADFCKVYTENAGDYLITQLITNLILNSGYDGIRFTSSLVNQGINYVIFNPNHCKIVSSGLYVIDDIRYSYKSIEEL